MAIQTEGINHYSKRKANPKLQESKSKTGFIHGYDNFIYLIVVIAPLTNSPQLVKIWMEHDAAGVSTISWFMFTIVSLSWLVYGILHKDRRIIIMNAGLMVMQAAIVAGALMYA